MNRILSTICLCLTLCFAVSTAEACCCCKEHNGGDKDTILVHHQQAQPYSYDYRVTYHPTMQYGRVVPWHPGQILGRSIRAARGCPVPSLYGHYQTYIPQVTPLPPQGAPAQTY